MRTYNGLDKPKSPAWFAFWKSMFVAIIIAFVGFMYVATSSVEYVWSWQRIPQYFWVEGTSEIRAENQGYINEITESTSGVSIIIEKDSGGTATVKAPANAEMMLSEGDYAYMGDTLATYNYSQAGVLLTGLWVTLKVSVMAIFFGIAVGIITGLCRISENPALRWLAITYIELIRGSPLLVQIYLWYFVAGNLINTMLSKASLGAIPPLWYGVMALAVFTGAYVAEIVRAGIQSVSRGQTEAARSLGLTKAQAMRKVILPQAMRRILPPLAGQFISLVKDSSLLGVIAIRELTKATRELVSSSLMSFELWITCALMYLVLTFTLSLFVQYLERRAIR